MQALSNKAFKSRYFETYLVVGPFALILGVVQAAAEYVCDSDLFKSRRSSLLSCSRDPRGRPGLDSTLDRRSFNVLNVHSSVASAPPKSASLS